MATFTINVGDTSFYVTKEVISTECANIYTYTVVADTSDTIDITLSGNHENEYYTTGVSQTSFNDTASVSYSTSLTIHFIIQNSGNPGVFDSCDVTIENVTQALSFNDTVQRENDNEKCGATAVGDFDGLSDTPGTKTGSALKYLRVNAAETEIEYVNVAGDIHYEHDQPIASATWNINHNLGKFPSVTIVDTSGDEVEGAVNHVNNNNITITFSASFAGKAYLN